VIRTRGLVHTHAGGPRLCFPDVDVPAGGRLLLRGPSGSGKSTWLALASGLPTPDEGQIEVAGQSVGALRAGARDAWRGATLGLLPQRLHLSAELSVERNLALAYLAAGQPVDRRAIDDALRAMGLHGLRDRRPHALSGGQALRVALARALLRRPAVLLADEPTASLDAAACARVLTVLGDATREAGATLVVATHDARAVAAMTAIGETTVLDLTGVESLP
jgi:putative ABC transport system ATP-binding protein